MTNKLSALFTRAENIYKQAGLVTLFKRIFSFLLSYEISTFYLYERTLTKWNEANFMPKIQNITHRMVEVTQQLDELSNDGFDLSLLDINQARNWLEKRAILSLGFVEGELSHINWSAMTEKAKNTFNWHPYKVDFLNNEACAGGTWTNPKYRRHGLSMHFLYKRDKFLIEKGAKKLRSFALSSNIAGQRMATKQGAKLYAKARYLRISGLWFWKEIPIVSTNNND